jgi:hypothetical protein
MSNTGRDEDISSREVPESVQRKQVIVIPAARSYLKELCEREGKTYSQKLSELLPDDPEAHRLSVNSKVQTKVTEEVDDAIDDIAGERVDKGEVISALMLHEAIKNGDIERAQLLARDLPDLLLKSLTFIEEVDLDAE